MRPNLDDVVTLDFETYFDSEYSLKKKELNMTDYVWDERFLAHCVSIKIGNGPTRIYWYEDIRPALAAVAWDRVWLLCHNTAFDGLILSHHYGAIPKFYLDTLSMARALHAGSSRASLDVLGQLYGLGGKNPNILLKMKGHREIPSEIREEASIYCIGDVDKCHGIFHRMVDVYPPSELALIDWTIRQFCDPCLRVDVERAQAEVVREGAKKQALLEKIGLDEEELQSAAKLAARLKALDVEPPLKISPRTKMVTWAFSLQDDEFMALGAHPDERVRDLIAARIAVKSTIAETRAERFVKIGDRPLPVALNYAAAHTLRWGGANKMNLQNLEKEELDENNIPIPFTGELRKSILAPEDHVVVVADSGQIEARITAYLAQQTDLLELFASGGDPYLALACEVYKRQITKANRDERAVGKAAVLGLGFYMGAKRFQSTLALGLLGPKVYVDLEFAQSVVDTFRQKNRKIVALWRSMDVLLYKMLMKACGVDRTGDSVHKLPCGMELEFDGRSIWLPTGMGLHYPDLRAEIDEETGRPYNYTYRSNNEVHRIHSGVLTENMVQRLARDVVAEQLLRIDERFRVCLMSHDELGSVALGEQAEECLNFMLREMSKPPEWMPGLPLKAEGGYARNYSK